MEKTILQKLFDAQQEIGKVVKNAKNPHFKNTYADINAILDSVEPLMESKGLLLLQPIQNNKVCTQIIDIESGESIESSIELSQGLTSQQLGSQITYFRRYSIQSLLSLQAEDDDAQKASYVAPQAAKPQPKPYVAQAAPPVTTAEPKAQLEPEFKLF
jgi:hypothetical protein